MADVNSWNALIRFEDKFPEIDLGKIASISSRIKSLMVRSSSTLLNTDFIQLVGAQFMLEGLEHHHNRYMESVKKITSLLDFDGIDRARHDAAAWVNVVGQFQYFRRSAEDKKWGAVACPTSKKIVDFRNKYTGHRSIDFPQKESPFNFMFQALSLGPGPSFWHPRNIDTVGDGIGVTTVPDKDYFLIFKIQISDRWEQLNIEQDHLEVMNESLLLMERIFQ